MESHTWMGLAKVEDCSGRSLLDGNRYAYVNCIARATSESDYCALVARCLERDGFRLLGLEDVEMYSRRNERVEIDRDLHLLAAAAENGHDVQYGAFHSFPEGK